MTDTTRQFEPVRGQEDAVTRQRGGLPRSSVTSKAEMEARDQADLRSARMILLATGGLIGLWAVRRGGVLPAVGATLSLFLVSESAR